MAGPQVVHDPGKIVVDLAAGLALGGDCLADIAVLREQPELDGDLPRVLRAIRFARATAPSASCSRRTYQPRTFVHHKPQSGHATPPGRRTHADGH